MKVFTTQTDLQNYINQWYKGRKIGFVPTMGALHRGHISLIEESNKICDVTVCSIFINPTQFNDPSDLAKYPRTLTEDLKLLENADCDIVYTPEVSDLYHNLNDELTKINLGGLDFLFEGEQRPGHFDGVVTIVKKLFHAIHPTDVFFGQKDFQQCLIVRKMIRHFQMDIKFHMCPTIRENDGLAMSSRNIRLSSEERNQAIHISEILFASKDLKYKFSPELLEQYIITELSKYSLMKVEYVKIVETADLKSAINWEHEAVILIAVKLPSTRLIDNMII